MSDRSFPKAERIVHRREYEELGKHGTKLHTKNFIIIWSVSGEGMAKIGITASKKVGSAVQRNRVKRLIREYYRLHKDKFAGAFFNIIARKGAAMLDYPALCREFDEMLPRIAKQI
ncbi:MAG: ribonuclease P protein component [Geobacter sp.]|nr:ribonuclease P protein component [Geobacter sp.]